MKKTVIFTLTSIHYTGDSIGNDIRIDGEVLGRKFTFEKKIKKGETALLKIEIGRTQTDQPSITAPLTFQITEKDPLFSDVGKKTQEITVDLKGVNVQRATSTVEVRESRGWIGRKRAVFEIVCEARIVKSLKSLFANKSIGWWEQWKEIKQYSYRGVSEKEDYNRYDSIIKNIVAKWNKEFFDEKFSPDEPLDPNLVKAMVYIESRMGYFQSKDYPAYPDVMQVADQRNPAIHTLNNDGWKNKKRVRAQEKEWSKGKISILNYHGRANGVSPQESIVWGVRWLYHCAQGITYEKTRYWRLWKEAVKRYNGEGNERYTREVFAVYLKGVDIRTKPNIKIFLLLFAVLATLIGISFGVYAFSSQGSVPTSIKEATPLYKTEETIELAFEEKIEKRVRALMDKKMMEYKKQGTYYYGSMFEEPFLLCKRFESICFSDLIFPTYLGQFLAYAQSMNALREVIESLEIVTPYNSFYDDLDNDGVAELGMVLIDNLNHEYLEILIVDRTLDFFSVARAKVDRPYSGGSPRIFDLTGDSIPEIVIFSSGGRQDIQAYVFQYVHGELKKLFSLERDYLRADIIFTDQNRNRLMEIKVKGEQYGDECMACDHKKIEESFEYNPRTKKIEQIHNRNQ